MSNRQYDYNLAASLGASQRLDVTGGFVKVITTSGGAIGVKLDGGQEIQLEAGQGIRLPDGAAPFRDVTLRNLQAVAQQGRVFIGSALFEDSTVAGNVRVIDSVSPSCRTDAGQDLTVTAFAATQILAPAANVNGAIVRASYVEAKAGAAGNLTLAMLIASPNVPTGSTAAQQLALARVFDSDPGFKSVSNFAMSRLIPVGWGLYYCRQTNVTAPGANAYLISWELL